jgi:hypothetical protein
LRFSIAKNRVLSDLGTDVVEEGILHNFALEKNQLKNGDKPWKGGREKDPSFVQNFIASIGMSPHLMSWILKFLSICKY